MNQQVKSARAAIWALEEKLWARRAYRQQQRLNANRSGNFDEGELRFGDDIHQALCWFAPSRRTTEGLPAVFFIHGGGWQSGDALAYRFVGRRFAQQGSFACVVGYRLAPQFIFPAPLVDLATGVRAGLELARERGRAGRTILIGQSAGAHLAALLAYGGERLLPEMSAPPVDALVLLGGPLSFAAGMTSGLWSAARALVGPAGQLADVDPARYVNGDEAVSVLCVHGAKDYLVPPEHSVAFIQQVNVAGGGMGELLLLQRFHHADLLGLLYERSAESDRVHLWVAQQVSG